MLAAYQDLASRFDAVVIEGAGSVSELNLRQHDLVNLGLVTRIRAPWILVADIERGGVFASVIGTAHLLSPEERALFRGFAINKFRGDVTLFDDGVQLLEQETEAPCFGVFPYAADIHLDAEDSLALKTRAADARAAGRPDRDREISAPVQRDRFPAAHLGGLDRGAAAGDYDFIILPGSKNTIADLQWLRTAGLADWILVGIGSGTRVIGICGGFQMLGRAVDDPTGIESDLESAAGLGLIPSTTTLTREKQTRAVRATTAGGVTFGGYEIHVGVTAADPAVSAAPFATLEDGTTDGFCGDRVIGTYLHGALESADVCAEVFGVPMPAARRQGRALPATRALVRATRAPSGPIGVRLTMREIETHSWECLREEPRFELRRAGRYLVARAQGVHHVISTSARHGGWVDHVGWLVNHQSCEGTAHVDRHRVDRGSRHGGIPRPRLRGAGTPCRPDGGHGDRREHELRRDRARGRRRRVGDGGRHRRRRGQCDRRRRAGDLARDRRRHAEGPRCTPAQSTPCSSSTVR